MPVVLGTDGYRYQVAEDWAKLPDGWKWDADVAAVGVDAHDNVYAFSRGAHPMIVFDRNGNFLRSWGEGVFIRPHGVHMAPDGTVFLTDDGDHTVRQCTLEGRVLLTLGIPGKPAPYMSGEPFHRCTHTALSPQGDIYVSDGYGNSRVHKYSPDGKLLFSWGEPGTDPGQFNIAHNICCDPDGWVYVADRENHRIQVFDGNGKYETQWNNMHRPSGLYMETGTRTPRFFVGEIGSASIRKRASCWRGSATRMPGCNRASSSRRTGSLSTGMVIFTLARCRSPIGGAACAPKASQSRRGCGRCRSSSRSNEARQSAPRQHTRTWISVSRVLTTACAGSIC